MAKTDTRKRAFLKYGITGAALGAAAIAGLDQLFSPNTAPGKETTVTQTSTVTAVLPAPLPSTRIDFRTKAGEYEQSIRYLYGVDKANFCMLCQPIIQECEGLILYVTADTVRNYEALARSLLNSGIDASQKALAAFTDINSKLSALNQGELSILTILQNYKSDSAQYKTALANWINDHAPSGPNANIQNSTAGSSTREWKVMFDSEQLLKQIQLLNGAITADTSPRLGDSSRLLKIQDGYLARNAGYVDCCKYSLATILEGAADLIPEFDDKGKVNPTTLWDQLGTPLFYEGLRNWPALEFHIEYQTKDDIRTALPRASIPTLCDYPDEILKPVDADVVLNPADPKASGINDPFYDVLGVYDTPHSLLPRVQQLYGMLDPDKQTSFVKILQAASPEQRFRIYYSIRNSVDPLTGTDYIASQAKTWNSEFPTEKVDLTEVLTLPDKSQVNLAVERFINAGNFRRAPFEITTASGAWSCKFENSLIEGIDLRIMKQYDAELEILNRERKAFKPMNFGPSAQVCILEDVDEIGTYLTGGHTTFDIGALEALQRVGVYGDMFFKNGPGGYTTLLRTWEGTTPARIWSYNTVTKVVKDEPWSKYIGTGIGLRNYLKASAISFLSENKIASVK